ncbi:MAG: cytochrome c oxidase subunit 3 [Saprospiraceae bacterium]|jgi:cytochrome c oxidase subunit III|nr:cytochrome c oxidase subunit 3 [Saprospiraceae bacterium]MDP4701585.1 cytochrome c oxidase subunit 3 [Saprospiraceae bacterium]MDP4809886.1 cytochrome c oxidase subunit 3 [Saprospiraceae bacterium]MDP4812929.1 cytochrome c oxidase subunit 3 [Saprospiraceae bacterium]MDP4852708.1 cytochrome c oxidase subunit 3 [Saprospiraceae bacterium]
MSTLENTVYSRNKIHPQKFALLVSCASVVMLFAALTSAYVVRQAAGNWLEFPMPVLFLYSTLTLIVSSLTLHFSYKGFLAGNVKSYKYLLLLTFALGVLFIYLQYKGWMALVSMGVELGTNPSGSFLYVLSGLHAAHILGGLAAVFVAILHAFILPYEVSAKRKLRFEMTQIYWHFVDILWIYLIVFLWLQQQS